MRRCSSSCRRPRPSGRRPTSVAPSHSRSCPFPELTATRARVLDALIATSAERDARRRLMVGPSLAAEVARNEQLRELPARPAIDTYAGPLYGGLDPAGWSPDALRRSAKEVVIVSALWGALRPSDRIPPYRLHVCSRLVGMDRLEPTWRTVLPAVLSDAAAGSGPILDLRSRAYQAVGRPHGLDDQTVKLRVRPSSSGGPHIGDVIAKRIRGEAASHLLEAAGDAEDPLDLAEVLATRWPVEVEAPDARSRSWTITLEAPF